MVLVLFMYGLGDKMKFFFVAEMATMNYTVKIVNDIGEFIALRGVRCDDHIPAYGIELDEGSQETLTKWINRK